MLTFEEFFPANKLQQHGALEVDDLLPINLQNEIHPIFARDRFVIWSDAAYDIVKPGLRLASKFLTEDAMLEWWVHTAFGVVAGDDSGLECLMMSPKERHRSALHITRAAITELAEHITLGVYDRLDSDAEAQTVAQRNGIRRGTRMVTKFTSPVFAKNLTYTPFIRISKEYETYARLGYAAATNSQEMRFQFHFATTLAHEVCHAFWLMRAGETLPEVNTPAHEFYAEPRHSDRDPPAMGELGLSWETFTFGFRLGTIDSKTAPTYAILGAPWKTVEEQETGDIRYLALPMSWINQWFREELWQDVARSGRTAIPPPRVTLSLMSRLRIGTLEEAV